MPNTHLLLECIAKTAVKHLLKGVVDWATFGMGGAFLFDVWESWRKAVSEEERRKGLQDLECLHSLQETIKIEEVTLEAVHDQPGLPDWKRIWLDSYLKLIPLGVRRSHEPRIEKPEDLQLIFPLVNSIGMRFMHIPAGIFCMGSPEYERDRHAPEGPQHNVTITTSFYLGAFTVTQWEFESIMRHNPAYFHQSNGKEQMQYPVERISWHQAMEFCHWLSNLPAEKVVGRSYRLPTEAEWEYACRAGRSTVFHYGDLLTCSQANFDGSQPYGDNYPGASLEKTTPIGSYHPNDFGLFDMHGNVWEWCSDWADWPEHGHYYSTSPPFDPTGPLHGSCRIMRGGSWADPGKNCRSATRGAASPNAKKEWIGFRVVCKLADGIG